MNTEEVTMEFTEDGKHLIIEQAAARLVKKEEFFDRKYAPVAKKLHALLEFGDEFGPIMVAAIVAIRHFKWSPNDVVAKFKNRTLFNDLFDALQASGEVDKILATAETIYGTLDIETGTVKRQTLQ